MQGAPGAATSNQSGSSLNERLSQMSDDEREQWRRSVENADRLDGVPMRRPGVEPQHGDSKWPHLDESGLQPQVQQFMGQVFPHQCRHHLDLKMFPLLLKVVSQVNPDNFMMGILLLQTQVQVQLRSLDSFLRTLWMQFACAIQQMRRRPYHR